MFTAAGAIPGATGSDDDGDGGDAGYGDDYRCLLSFQLFILKTLRLSDCIGSSTSSDNKCVCTRYRRLLGAAALQAGVHRRRVAVAHLCGKYCERSAAA